ncbi:MAG: SEL1-like repeat protein [Alphaproteobacteria bacterium]|nr:SEL1-like repeat protein [Alphaproteobacteria bacterium]
MSILRALSIVIVSFYSVMFYSWQSLLPIKQSGNHLAWAQNFDAVFDDVFQEELGDENNTQTTEEATVAQGENATETPDAEAVEEKPEQESSGVMRTIGSLFVLDEADTIVEKTPLDHYIEGLEYYQQERYNLAFLSLRNAITGEEKEERAYFWIGKMYHLGKGGGIALKKAFEYYLLAYEAGDIKIYNPEIWQDLDDKNVKGTGYILGRLYYDGKHIERDDVKALQYLQKDADRNHVEANYYIALIHYEGYQVEKSYLLAVEYLQKASVKNYADAQVLLGRIYYRGEGYIGKDPERAITLFTKSARAGNMKGQYYLAGLYYVGDIVAQDYQQAKTLFESAAAQNYAPSQYFLGQLYYHGHGVRRDYQEALDWYKKAAIQQHAPSMLRVAQFYQLGYGVAEDNEEALEYYKKAALLGSADARFQLAMMYYGIDGNLSEVIALLYEAASNGHMMAQYNLGQFYRHGIGVTHDNLLAWVWFKIALHHGNQRAQQDVDAMQARLSSQQIQQGQDYLDNWLRDNNRLKSLAYNQ